MRTGMIAAILVVLLLVIVFGVTALVSEDGGGQPSPHAIDQSQ